jgi:Na+-driven multidrug efflux pump
VMAGGSWLLGDYFQLGLVGVWIAYAADEWLRGVVMAVRWLRLGWVPSAVATRRRIVRAALG